METSRGKSNTWTQRPREGPWQGSGRGVSHSGSLKSWDMAELMLKKVRLGTGEDGGGISGEEQREYSREKRRGGA